MTRHIYNPHRHVKIWLSKDPSVFMNFENQTRLIEMRLQNPDDKIHLIYDATLLNESALEQLNHFCNEHHIIPVDADSFDKQTFSENELKLYDYYKDEITHLEEGGNLAVASDILRWIKDVYELGTYTDLDVPVNTSHLPVSITVDAPLLLNIGSLQTRGKEIILSNNDYIAVVDPNKATDQIEKIQTGILNVLEQYDNDFIEKTIEGIGTNSFWNRTLIDFMHNRAEATYIAKSKEFLQYDDSFSSRKLRKLINHLMTDKKNYIDFNRLVEVETNTEVIQRLRTNLSNELGFIKWLFFNNEYNEIKNMLLQQDDILIDYLMKKERTLYLRSIVVCTTGPIAIAKALFNGYVFSTSEFKAGIEQYSFNHYDLQQAFITKNSIPIHENLFGMMKFLGTKDGELNDSSWLENGAHLQKTRGERLIEEKTRLESRLSSVFTLLKEKIQKQIQQINTDSQGVLGFYRSSSRQLKVKTLTEALYCFNEEGDFFDTEKFSTVLKGLQGKEDEVFAGLFHSKTQELIGELDHYAKNATLLGLTKNRYILFNQKNKPEHVETEANDNQPGLVF